MSKEKDLKIKEAKMKTMEALLKLRAAHVDYYFEQLRQNMEKQNTKKAG